jgi:hypothetical protein
MITRPAREDLSGLPPTQQRERKREWNRGPLSDLFPRIPSHSLERVLDICIDKDFTYNLSLSKQYNARRYTSIVVAHIRHEHSDYDRLLREEKLERYEARRRTAEQVWKVLREWCPWDDSNGQLKPCLQATLVPPEERGLGWDPMDIDDSDVEQNASEVDDPMDLD